MTSLSFVPSSICWLLLLFVHFPHSSLRGQDEPAADQESDSIAALRATGVAYVEAFNKHDAQALAEFWSPTAVYTNRMTGEQVTGREAIAAQFTSLFEALADCKMKVEVESLDLLSPNVAVEKGVATLLTEEPEPVPYSAVYIRQGDLWLLDRVTDDPQVTRASNYEHLKPLEWMLGSWIDQGDESVSVEYACNWTKNRNFLTRTFAVSIEGEIDLSGLQIIGWDPLQQQIRSWTFDSDGSFAQAHWSNEGDQWYVVTKGTTADGKRVSAVNVLRRIDADSHTLESVQRSVDGSLLPDSPEVIIVRQ